MAKQTFIIDIEGTITEVNYPYTTDGGISYQTFQMSHRSDEEHQDTFLIHVFNNDIDKLKLHKKVGVQIKISVFLNGKPISKGGAVNRLTLKTIEFLN